MRWLILCLCLVGCDSAPSKAPATANRAERIKRAEQASLEPPKVMRHRMESGELLVVDVPVLLAPGFPDTSKCFVWRDAEFKTASLQCPGSGDVTVPHVPD